MIVGKEARKTKKKKNGCRQGHTHGLSVVCLEKIKAKCLVDVSKRTPRHFCTHINIQSILKTRLDNRLE